MTNAAMATTQYVKLLPLPPVLHEPLLAGSFEDRTIGIRTTCSLSTHCWRHARTEDEFDLPGSPGNWNGRVNDGLFGVQRLVASEPAELLPSHETQPKLPGPFEPLVNA